MELPFEGTRSVPVRFFNILTVSYESPDGGLYGPHHPELVLVTTDHSLAEQTKNEGIGRYTTTHIGVEIEGLVYGLSSYDPVTLTVTREAEKVGQVLKGLTDDEKELLRRMLNT